MEELEAGKNKLPRLLILDEHPKKPTKLITTLALFLTSLLYL
jgi:hypothetical protein